jgi:hypothetical protein
MKCRIFFTTFAVILALFMFSACQTVDETPLVPASEPKPDSEPEPMREPEPLHVNWPGTAWVLPDPADKSPKEFPGYRGFHLGVDGRLLLINLDNAAGDTWQVSGNRITLSLLEGTPGLPLDGTFLIFQADSGDQPDTVQRIRLVPEATPNAVGITLNRVKVKVDIIENHWIPMSLEGGETVMWPMNREIHLMLLPDVGGLGVLGFGGENRFRGGILLKDENFVIGPLSMTRRAGPASEFENLYVQRITEANRFVQAGDDFFLYTDTYPLAAFRVRLFD